MKKAVAIGDMVKFIGVDGKAAYCKVTGLELDERSRIMAILEIQSGQKKGHVGAFPAKLIRWNGKVFVADAREQETAGDNRNYKVRKGDGANG